MKLTKMFMMLLLTLTITQCSGEAEKSIRGGGTNPEETPLPPNPNFSDSLSLQDCASLFSSLVSDTKCWVRGEAGDDSYTELVLVPDGDNSTTGFLIYGTKADSTDFDYTINNCDSDGVHLTQAGGITILISGNELNLQFDSWKDAYRYKVSNTCTL